MMQCQHYRAPWTSTLRRFQREESGQDLVEYAFVMVLIALAATAGMGVVANGIVEIFQKYALKIGGVA